MYAIETAGLTKYYGKSRGIIEVDLKIEEGAYFGFIGPNGSSIEGTVHPYLKEVGYMPSEAMFYSHMRVREVIALSAALRKKDCSAEAEKLCERLELDMGKRIEELSVGDGQHGTARWATKHEIRKTYRHIPFTPERWREQAKHGEKPTTDNGAESPDFLKPNSVTVKKAVRAVCFICFAGNGGKKIPPTPRGNCGLLVTGGLFILPGAVNFPLEKRLRQKKIYGLLKGNIIQTIPSIHPAITPQSA